ncbi:MAG: MltA domain-containing protein [Sedimentisphaeraceae bacterium JB056]
MYKKLLLVSAAMLVLTFAGCKTKTEEKLDYNRELLPGEEALVKITDPAMMPDFTKACNNLYGLEEAINNSLNYMGKPSSHNFFPINGISHQRVVDSLRAFRDLINQGYGPSQLNDQIAQKFDVYMSVGCDKQGTVLFTGYYTPIFNGSQTRSERFKYPLYGMPDGLVKNESGETIGIEGAGGQLMKCPPRSQIESSGILNGKEIIWLEDPFEVYIAHVQGSAKIRIEDGSLVTVGYAATNGYEYKSITKDLSANAGIPLDKMSLSAMIDYFSRNKDQVPRYVNTNPRFVFFRITQGNPTGSINEPVMRLRTIATDKTIFPRAALTFIDTKLPRNIGNEVVIYPYKGFFLDQDTGGAIRAPGRCDIYMGQGDEAGLVAGKTYEEGKLYYLVLK